MSLLFFAAVGLTLSGVAAEPLAPAAFESLPAGSIRPEGWLGRNLDMQADGLIGRLYETSPWRERAWYAEQNSAELNE